MFLIKREPNDLPKAGFYDVAVAAGKHGVDRKDLDGGCRQAFDTYLSRNKLVPCQHLILG